MTPREIWRGLGGWRFLLFQLLVVLNIAFISKELFTDKTARAVFAHIASAGAAIAWVRYRRKKQRSEDDATR